MAAKGEPNGLSCEICGSPLTGKQRRACSQKCRDRLRTNTAASIKDTARQIAETQAVEVVRRELARQVEPIVRDALTAEVLNATKTMIELMPASMKALAKNLDEGDLDQSKAAATIILRYTMGNPSVAPPPIEADKAPLQVQFLVPRAEDTQVDAEATAVELLSDNPIITEEDGQLALKECAECHIPQPPSNFVGQSLRCKSCHAQLLDRVQSEYGKLELG